MVMKFFGCWAFDPMLDAGQPLLLCQYAYWVSADSDKRGAFVEAHHDHAHVEVSMLAWTQTLALPLQLCCIRSC